jgi:hypothetical protein
MGVGGQNHAPAALPPGKTRYPCIGGWLGPNAGLDGCRKSRPHRYSIPGLLKLATYTYIKLLGLKRLDNHRIDNSLSPQCY